MTAWWTGVNLATAWSLGVVFLASNQAAPLLPAAVALALGLIGLHIERRRGL